MPRSRRPGLGRRSQSNVRRATLRANSTAELRDIQNDNSRIGMSELRYKMTENRSLEPLDRTLKDHCDNQNIFGGELILLSHDFHQLFQSTVADELNTCLKSLNLWWHVKTLQLTTNMRVVLQQDQTAVVFSRQLEMVKSPLDSLHYPQVFVTSQTQKRSLFSMFFLTSTTVQ